MKTGLDFLRTAILGAIIGHVFLVRKVIKINQDPWLPLDDDGNKSHDANDQNKEDENKFSNRQSFSEDYDAEEYKDILKHLKLYKGDEQEIVISSSSGKKKRFPNRKVINILPKVVEKEDVVNLLQWLSGAEKTLGQALRPVTSAVSTVLHSLSLDTGTDRQASIPAVDSLVDTAQFAVDQLITRVQENPDPPLVLSTLFLSLVTGNLIGNSISDKVSKAEKDKKDKEKEMDKKKKRKRKKKEKEKEKEKDDEDKEKDKDKDMDKDNEDEDDQFPILDDGPSIDNCPIGYELVYVQDCFIYQLSKSRSFPFELPGFGPSCTKDGFYCRDPFEAANGFLGGGWVGGGAGGGGGGGTH